MTWEVAHAESFPLDLGRAPKKVRNAWQRTVLPVLRDHPDQADPPAIKKLAGFKSLWRLRVSDEYRLVYRVEHPDRTVVLLLLDHRSKVYDRAGVSEDGTPTARIVVVAPEELETPPTEEQVGRSEIELAAQGHDPAAPDRSLEAPLDLQRLEGWGVSPEYHNLFAGVASESDLMALSSNVPDSVMERVLNGLWPPAIEEVIQEPVRIMGSSEQMLAAAEGGQDLESFLLRLDEEQTRFVNRFDVPSPNGPWLLKGGPGSGKSTVALYCIASLIRRRADQLPIHTGPTKILFTTYTHSLINAAGHLLRTMGIDASACQLDVTNVDKLASKDMPRSWYGRRVVSESNVKEYATESLAGCLLDDNRFSFDRKDVNFLIDEVDWVIVGQDVKSVDEYLGADRAGRGRALPEAQRRQVWRFWERFSSLLEARGVCLFSQRLQAALRSASARYDYVFIDEAQDLKPVAVRYCVRLCRTPAHVFLTAGSNQSIYGTGMSWPRVAEDLNFSGRAMILKRNYRTTQEIWQAISAFAADGADQETLNVEAVYSGPYPALVRYQTTASRTAAMNEFLTQSLLRERLASSCAAVLCPSFHQAEEIAKQLAPELNARAMRSKDTDLSHPGVKVLTMHAAKGLQFPIVAVAGLQAGQLPTPVPVGMDDAEHQRRQKRLLFVACSRAMRRLAVFAPTENPSPYTGELTDEYWETMSAR